MLHAGIILHDSIVEAAFLDTHYGVYVLHVYIINTGTGSYRFVEHVSSKQIFLARIFGRNSNMCMYVLNRYLGVFYNKNQSLAKLELAKGKFPFRQQPQLV